MNTPNRQLQRLASDPGQDARVITLRAVSILLCFHVGACNPPDEAHWQDAPSAQHFYRSSATQQALVHENVENLSLQCADLLPAARAGLEDPGSPALRVLIDTCAEVRLGFGGEVRCIDETLQVRCL